MKWRFAITFLLTFAILVVLWWRFDIATRYRVVALATAQALSPVVNGWFLYYDEPGMVDPVTFRRGERNLPMLLQLPALSMGLMPLVSLIVATPRIGVRRGALTVVAGSVLYFLVHVTVVLTYPFIMDRPNFIKDTAGVFSGLMAFVVAPLALWFVLTYPVLRPLWQLSAPPAAKP